MIRAGSPETDALDMGMIDLLQTKRQYGRGSVTPLSKKFQKGDAMYGAIVEDIEKQQRRRMQAEKEAKIEAKKKAKEGKLSADEVYYVDKHRAGAQDSGAGDLAVEMRKQQRKDAALIAVRLVATDMPWEIYYKEGILNLSRGHLSSALRNFCQAIAKDKEEESPYIHRAECHLRMGNPDKALQDVDEALSLQKIRLKAKPNYMKTLSNRVTYHALKIRALSCKAESLYAIHEFEKALIHFHRCLALRPDLKAKFADGVIKTKRAILNSVHDKCFDAPDLELIVRAEREKFRTFSRFLKNPLSTYVRKVQIAKRIKYLGQRTEEVPPPKRKSTVMERYRKQIRASSTPQEKDAALGPLSADYTFLEELTEEVASGRLNDNLQDAIAYLDRRKEFWRHEDPKNYRKTQPGPR